MPIEPDSRPSAATLDENSAVVSAAQERARRMLHEGAPLRVVLSQLTMAGEAIAKAQAVCSILLLDKAGLLRNGASPNLPADYLDAIDRLKPHPDAGTCAAAAATGEVVITPDFRDDRRWAELRHLPLALGFFGAWSQPIKTADGRVLGTFGTYYRERREPRAAERQAIAQLAATCAEAINATAGISA